MAKVRFCEKWQLVDFIILSVIYYFLFVLTEVVCPDPGFVANGRRVIDPTESFNCGKTVQYICDENYELQGSRVITCLSTGAFSAGPPACVLVGKSQVNCLD